MKDSVAPSRVDTDSRCVGRVPTIGHGAVFIRRLPGRCRVIIWLGDTVVARGHGARVWRSDPLGPHEIVRAALEDDAIQHIIVIDLENENFADTFGPTSAATYLNGTLLSKGELIPSYYGTSHVSLGNYVAQVSGQAPTRSVNNDCLDLSSLVPPFNHIVGGFTNVSPGTDATDSALYPGQVVGDGCVYPAPTKATHGAQTIADQLDAMQRPNRKTNVAT